MECLFFERSSPEFYFGDIDCCYYFDVVSIRRTIPYNLEIRKNSKKKTIREGNRKEKEPISFKRTVKSLINSKISSISNLIFFTGISISSSTNDKQKKNKNRHGTILYRLCDEKEKDRENDDLSGFSQHKRDMDINMDIKCEVIITSCVGGFYD